MNATRLPRDHEQDRARERGLEQRIAQEEQKTKKRGIGQHVPTGKAVTVELLQNVNQVSAGARPVHDDLDELTQAGAASGSHKRRDSFPTQSNDKQQDGDGGDQHLHLGRVPEEAHPLHETGEPRDVNGLHRAGNA